MQHGEPAVRSVAGLCAHFLLLVRREIVLRHGRTCYHSVQEPGVYAASCEQHALRADCIGSFVIATEELPSRPMKRAFFLFNRDRFTIQPPNIFPDRFMLLDSFG